MKKLLVVLALFSLLLAGCAAADQTQESSVAPSSPTPRSSATVAVQATNTSTAVIPSTATPTLAPTVEEASPTPAGQAGEPELLGLAWFDDYDLLLGFEFPQPVSAEQVRVQLEGKPYTCQVHPQYAERLYCKGQGAKVLTLAWIRVFPAEGSQPLYEQQVYIPYFDNDYSNTFRDTFGAEFPAFKP